MRNGVCSESVRGSAGCRTVSCATVVAVPGKADVIVLGLPRGGVPVAAIAGDLGVALDVFLVRKLGVPGHEELAMGALATGGVRIVNQDVTRSLRIPDAVIEAVAARELR